MENYYTCAICNKNYDTVAERSACEAQCLADEKKKAEIMKLKQEAEAREKSEKTAIDAIEAAEDALKKYFKEYERLALHKEYPYLKMLFSNRMWWF